MPMASSMSTNSNSSSLFITHNPQLSPPSPPMPSTSPIQLSGFLDGDTIQVQGDTDNLQFSVRFDIHTKTKPQPQDHSPFPEQQTPYGYDSPPILTHNEEELNVNADANAGEICSDQQRDLNPMETTLSAGDSAVVTTRLRSGVLSPVNYYPLRRGNLQNNVLEKVLRRHRLPIRPCSSYTFFVMVNWGSVNTTSFREKSKILGEMWSKLPPNQKQVFQGMASKDNARYKRQCILLMGRRQKKR